MLFHLAEAEKWMLYNILRSCTINTAHLTIFQSPRGFFTKKTTFPSTRPTFRIAFSTYFFPFGGTLFFIHILHGWRRVDVDGRRSALSFPLITWQELKGVECNMIFTSYALTHSLNSVSLLSCYTYIHIHKLSPPFSMNHEIALLMKLCVWQRSSFFAATPPLSLSSISFILLHIIMYYYYTLTHVNSSFFIESVPSCNYQPRIDFLLVFFQLKEQ